MKANIKTAGLNTLAWILTLTPVAAGMPVLNPAVDGSEIVLTWEARPLNPGTSSEIFYGFQLEESLDLLSWSPLGDAIPTRIGGGAQSHTQRVAPQGGSGYFRLRLSLDLSGRDLNGVDLSGLDLNGADLTDTDLDGAILGGTLLHNADTTGLEITNLGGDPNSPIAGSVPLFRYVADEDSFEDTHPDLPQMPVSTSSVIVAFAPGATLASVNQLLEDNDAAIIGSVPGSLAGGVPALAILKLPVANFMDLGTVQDALRAHPSVQIASLDVALEDDAVPDPEDCFADWCTWSTTPGEENWSMEMSRIPQLWNFNKAVQKRIDNGDSTRLIKVGILDSGFQLDHPDLEDVILSLEGQPDPTPKDHGTRVAGVVAAEFDNETGIQGVSPFARLALSTGHRLRGTGTVLGDRRTLGESYVDAVIDIVMNHPDARIINISKGYGWANNNINPMTNPAAAALASEHGELFVLVTDMMAALNNGSVPLIITSAGNDSNDFSDGQGGFIPLPAITNDPMANASLEHQSENFLAVEGLQINSTLALFSNIDGNISAPGQDVTSCRKTSTYGASNGTSFAAPQVAGAMAYLLSLDPGLSNSQLRSLILGNAKPIGGGASPRLDAWASAMAIDSERGDDKVLRMLLDIDDGTLDGNLRERFHVNPDADEEEEDPTVPVDVANPDVIFSEDVDGDGGPGDGRIDMRDFRRWRDWFHIVNTAGPLLPIDLNGSVLHPKHDPNQNGVPFDLNEDAFARGDFNGDGSMNVVGASSAVPGALGGAQLTDLAVLQSRFADGLYEPEELDALVDSADIHISLYWFTEWNRENAGNGTTVDFVTVTVEDRVTREEVKRFSVPVPPAPAIPTADIVLTLEVPATYRIRVCGQPGGKKLGLAVTERHLFNFDKVCEDHWFSPRAFPAEETCEPTK